ncbi:MAG: PspA/IM30 family protein [Myxococcota bacterium]|nr:PspA/IM30 family protein [Myxococcota bacterium]
MAESLTTRVGRIVSGSANALVSAVENAAPDVFMEETIREVEKALDEVRVELGKAVASKHLASARLMDENRRHEELTGQIETALGEGREDLAEAAVARQLDIEAQIPILERTVTEAGDREKELEGYLAALQGRRREMCDELDRYRRAKRDGREGPSADREGASHGATHVRGEKASQAFDRVMRATTGVPTGPDKLQDAAQLAELEALARRNRIRERLAEARARNEAESETR